MQDLYIVQILNYDLDSYKMYDLDSYRMSTDDKIIAKNYVNTTATVDTNIKTCVEPNVLIFQGRMEYHIWLWISRSTNPVKT